MTKLDYENRPPRPPIPAKTWICLSLAAGSAATIFVIGAAMPPKSGPYLACYSVTLIALALLFTFMAWRSYYEHLP